MSPSTSRRIMPAALVAALLLSPAPASALSSGSMGAGGHGRYVPPLTNPVFNETPYITTEVRPIYLHQEIPGAFLTGGGTIDLFALQLRLALSDSVGLIATKDGYADIDFEVMLPDENGFANIAAGLKIALLSDPETDTIVSAGARYEVPLGDLESGGVELQGHGDGMIDVFVTGATTLDKLGVQGSVGTNIAVDSGENTSMLHYAAHVDYELVPGLFPIVELNGFTPIDDGDKLAVNFEGFDIVNFGSSDASTVITGAAGARFRLGEQALVGVAYELPLTTREDLLEWRVTTDIVFYR